MATATAAMATAPKATIKPRTTPGAGIGGDYDWLFKVVVVGESGAGKTALLLRYCDSDFKDSFMSTIGVDFRFRDVEVRRKDIGVKAARLQIWDTAGQERFRHITSSFYRAAHGIMVCFDVTDRSSFERVKEWLADAGKFATPNTRYLLVATKIDMNEERVVPEVEARQFAEERNLPYLETSARNNVNVDAAFSDVAARIVDWAIERKAEIETGRVHIAPAPRKPKKKRSCWGFLL